MCREHQGQEPKGQEAKSVATAADTLTLAFCPLTPQASVLFFGSILFLVSFLHIRPGYVLKTLLVPDQLPPVWMNSEAAAFTRGSLDTQRVGPGPQLCLILCHRPQGPGCIVLTCLPQPPYPLTEYCLSVCSVVELTLWSTRTLTTSFC